MSKFLKGTVAFSALTIATLAAFILIVFAECGTNEPFLITTSPGGKYEVKLNGQKERPMFWAEVRFSVIKDGSPFWMNHYLHSGDAFDLSFEIGYPDHRWVDENIVQFYNRENFKSGSPQKLILVNSTDRIVKYLYLQCWDKFLLFDIQPGSEITLLASPPKGDRPWVSFTGEFYDGQLLEEQSVFDENHNRRQAHFRINLSDNGVDIQKSYAISNH